MKYRPAIVRYRQIDHKNNKNNKTENSELTIVNIETGEVIKRPAKDTLSIGLYFAGDNTNVC
jgi:hypothetical protein